MRRVAFAIISTIVGLVSLLSFKTHATSIATPSAAVGTTSSSGGSGSAASSSTSTSTSTSNAASASGKSGTFTGSAVDTRYGPLQVRITVKNGKIADVTAVQYPSGPRSDQINASALPVLYQETTAANSAKIDMVSGATYTSTGYINSLQSALDQAGL